jgi:hypothetical protein
MESGAENAKKIRQVENVPEHFRNGRETFQDFRSIFRSANPVLLPCDRKLKKNRDGHD